MILYLVLSHKVATKSEVVYYIYRFETGDGSILTLVDMEKTTFSNRFYTHVVLHFFIRSSMFSEYMGDWHTSWSMVRSHKHVCVLVWTFSKEVQLVSLIFGRWYLAYTHLNFGNWFERNLCFLRLTPTWICSWGPICYFYYFVCISVYPYFVPQLAGEHDCWWTIICHPYFANPYFGYTVCTDNEADVEGTAYHFCSKKLPVICDTKFDQSSACGKEHRHGDCIRTGDSGSFQSQAVTDWGSHVN